MKKIDMVVVSFWAVLNALALVGCAGLETTGGDDETAMEDTATSAINGTLTVVNQATARCLDSNEAGGVYTLPCHGGNYQNWIVLAGGTPGSSKFLNVQTGRCLDSNGAGTVYTLPCNGGAFQDWFVTGGFYKTFIDAATARVLDSNGAGNVYANPSNQSSFQHWF